MKIFISYAESDLQTARLMYDFLQKAGLNPWMDEDILPGETVSHTVRQAIRDSSYFLALLSKKALSESGPIQRQLRIALRKSEEHPEDMIFIIPVRLEKCEVKNEFLRDIKPLDLFESSEAELEKLLRIFIHENQKNKKGASLSPLLQMDSESGRSLMKKFKKANFRKRLIWGLCLLLMAGLWYFSPLLHFHPKVDAHLASATRFLNSGMYSDALAQYEQALALCPECPKAVTGKKKAEFFKEAAENEYNPGDMLARLKNIPGLPEDDPHIGLLTGNMNARLGEEEKAERIYLEITRKEPEFAEAWFSLGVLYHKQGNREKARSMYEKAVRISENNFRYLDNLAYSCLETGQYGRAVESYEKLLNADASFLLAYAEIAKALWMDKKPDMALFYQGNLMKKMGNPMIADFPLNKAPWFFPVNGKSVILDNLTAKKYYAIYSLAATYCLLGLASEVELYVNKADRLKIESEDAIPVQYIQTLIEHDLSDIEGKYPEDSNIRTRAGEFRNRFLTADQLR